MRHPGILWVGALAALLGCGEADESDPPGLGPAPLHPVPGCERLDHRVCDVAKHACQARLMTLAACVRGNDISQPPEPPRVSTMTAAEYAAYLNASFAQDPPPSPNHYETTLVLLGLAQAGALSQQTVVAEQVEFVAGFYRHDTKDIVLVEHEEKLDATRNSILLVHEYIHALQDRDVDLQAFSEEHATSIDAFTAIRSLVEGEARLHESRYAAAVFGLDPATVDWSKRFSEAIELSTEALAEAPSVYGPAYGSFPYAWGTRYAHLLFEDGGLDAILARFASPPLTSRTVMASVDAALPEEPTPPAVTAPTPPVEWTPFTETQLGALGVSLINEQRGATPSSARAQALTWRNDRLFVFASSPPESVAHTAFVWHIDFAVEGDASVFAGRMAGASLTVARVGARVTVAGTTSGLDLSWAFAP